MSLVLSLLFEDLLAGKEDDDDEVLSTILEAEDDDDAILFPQISLVYRVHRMRVHSPLYRWTRISSRSVAWPLLGCQSTGHPNRQEKGLKETPVTSPSSETVNPCRPGLHG